MTQIILIITPLESVPIPSPLASYGARIDQLVYKLYGLTPEEIKIIENGK